MGGPDEAVRQQGSRGAMAGRGGGRLTPACAILAAHGHLGFRPPVAAGELAPPEAKGAALAGASCANLGGAQINIAALLPSARSKTRFVQ